MRFLHSPLCAVLALLFLLLSSGPAHGQTFAVGDGKFLLDGKPFQILSGEMHYPRIPREYWKDRMLKARAMGLNTICTYLFWNLHEPAPGKFDFSGNLDIAAYVRTAHEAGLKVIVRPGPYVCSEWDLGGLPAWLLKDRDIRVRCMDPRYMEAAGRYIRAIGEQLRDLELNDGGPIILAQVENEYGSYGNDKTYLRTLEGMMREAGFTVPFFTSDGGAQYLLESGTLPGVLPVVNFGGDAAGQFAALDAFRSNIPRMNGEFWCGWFTHWGDSAWGSSDLDENLRDLRWMLERGYSFNLYMFHGGTNFGWMAGANYDGKYYPDVTSYDYDAPLDEAGRPTKKYLAFRDLLKQFQPPGAALPDLPEPLPMIEISSIAITDSAALFENLPEPVLIVQPKSMEELGQDYGYILYRTTLIGPKSGTLTVTNLNDYGLVYLDGKYIGAIDRTKGETSLKIPKDAGGSEHRLDILVEAMGRINFGQQLIDRKGITDRVTLSGITLMDWKAYPLPLDEQHRRSLRYGAPGSEGPKFYRGSFSVAKRGDTFLDMTGWKKGVVWVNGHHLGRYWDWGPQRRLFVPAPWLNEGANEVIIFDAGDTHPPTLKTMLSMQ